MPSVAPKSRAEWRAWLEKHHAKADEVTLVFYKLETGVSSLTYNDAIEEALCFGWIDGVKHAIDAERYSHRMTPRKSGSRWSALNKARAERMIEAGAMKPAGMAHVEAAKRDGRWKAAVARQPAPMPYELAVELKRHDRAFAKYNALAPSHQRAYRDWIADGKREETRTKRAKEAIKLLLRGAKLGVR